MLIYVNDYQSMEIFFKTPKIHTHNFNSEIYKEKREKKIPTGIYVLGYYVFMTYQQFHMSNSKQQNYFLVFKCVVLVVFFFSSLSIKMKSELLTAFKTKTSISIEIYNNRYSIQKYHAPNAFRYCYYMSEGHFIDDKLATRSKITNVSRSICVCWS